MIAPIGRAGRTLIGRPREKGTAGVRHDQCWRPAVAGVAFIAIAIMYWTVPPKDLPLPNFLGHESGVSAVHMKHGIASFLVGLACFAFAWFQSGPRHKTVNSAS